MRDLDVALFVGYETSDPEGDARFGQDAIGMKITSPGRQTLWLNLTHYSEEELVSLKTILNVALDAAIPVARSVDEAAQRELDSGAESVSPRLFRIRPMLILRDIAAKLAPTDNNNKETDEHDPLGSELAGESTPG